LFKSCLTSICDSTVSADNAAPISEASRMDAPVNNWEIKPATSASPAPDTLQTLDDSAGEVKTSLPIFTICPFEPSVAQPL